MKIYYNECNDMFYFEVDGRLLICNYYGKWYPSCFRLEEFERYSSVINNDGRDIILICEVSNE